MTLFRYLKNVLSGNFKHWNDAHEPFVETLDSRISEFPSAERAVLSSSLTAAVFLVTRLVGPDPRTPRILNVSPKSLGRREYFHLYYMIFGSLLTVYIETKQLRKVAPHLESAFATIFVNPPRRDECFCTFESLLIEKRPSDAYLYLLREIQRVVRAPPPEFGAEMTQALDYVQSMTIALDIMNEAVERSFRQLVETTGAPPSYVM